MAPHPQEAPDHVAESNVTRFGVQDDFIAAPRSALEGVRLPEGYQRVSPEGADIQVAVRGHVVVQPIPEAGMTLVILAPGLGQRLAEALATGIRRLRRPSIAQIGTMLCDHIVGHTAGLLVSSDELVAFTDHLGSMPVFVARSTDQAKGPFVGTSLKDVAKAAGNTVADPVSVREFVDRGTVVSPYSLYQGVERIWAGTVESWGASTARPIAHRAHSYWKPVRDREPSTRELVAITDHARATLLDSVAQVIDSSDSHTLMLSAGEDSRVLAAIIAAQPARTADVRAVIFLDDLNREFRIARRIARILGIPLDVRLREPDHYVRDLRELIERSGLAFDLTHAHAVGLVDPDPSRIVMDGRSADAYWKAYNLPSTRGRWTLDRPAVQGGLERHVDAMLAQYTHEDVRERRREKLRTIAEIRPAEDVISWAKLWPTTDRMTHGMAWSNRLIGPNVFPYAFPAAVRAFIDVPEPWKLNRRFSRQVFNPVLGKLRWLPASKGSIPGLGPRLDTLSKAGTQWCYANVDRARSMLDRPAPARGPWPPSASRRRSVKLYLAGLSADSVNEAVELAGLGDIADALSTARRERLAQVATAVDLGILDVP
jgi:hypothetical protein